MHPPGHSLIKVRSIVHDDPALFGLEELANRQPTPPVLHSDDRSINFVLLQQYGELVHIAKVGKSIKLALRKIYVEEPNHN